MDQILNHWRIQKDLSFRGQIFSFMQSVKLVVNHMKEQLINQVLRLNGRCRIGFQ